MMNKVAYWLLIVGGLNWLLVGLLQWDIGSLFGGQEAVVSRIVYVLVGVSALMVVFKPGSCCNHDHSVSPAPQQM